METDETLIVSHIRPMLKFQGYPSRSEHYGTHFQDLQSGWELEDAADNGGSRTLEKDLEELELMKGPEEPKVEIRFRSKLQCQIDVCTSGCWGCFGKPEVGKDLGHG